MKAIGNSEHKFLSYVIGISRLTVLSPEIKLVNIYLDIFTISKFMVYKQQKKTKKQRLCINITITPLSLHCYCIWSGSVILSEVSNLTTAASCYQLFTHHYVYNNPPTICKHINFISSSYHFVRPHKFLKHFKIHPDSKMHLPFQDMTINFCYSSN